MGIYNQLPAIMKNSALNSLRVAIPGSGAVLNTINDRGMFGLGHDVKSGVGAAGNAGRAAISRLAYGKQGPPMQPSTPAPQNVPAVNRDASGAIFPRPPTNLADSVPGIGGNPYSVEAGFRGLTPSGAYVPQSPYAMSPRWNPSMPTGAENIAIIGGYTNPAIAAQISANDQDAQRLSGDGVSGMSFGGTSPATNAAMQAQWQNFDARTNANAQKMADMNAQGRIGYTPPKAEREAIARRQFAAKQADAQRQAEMDLAIQRGQVAENVAGKTADAAAISKALDRQTELEKVRLGADSRVEAAQARTGALKMPEMVRLKYERLAKQAETMQQPVAGEQPSLEYLRLQRQLDELENAYSGAEPAPTAGAMQGAGVAKQPLKVTTKADYDSLPDGAPFIWNGKQGIKGQRG